MHEIGIDINKGCQHESALAYHGMRYAEVILLYDTIAVE
jgi:hypothetical protein